jgi:PST family polysaccharide transporter
VRRELGFALFAHPTVQLVRFGGKAALAWFLVVADFGEADFAGVLVNLALIGAVLGLDEAAIYAPNLGADLWRRLRRVHHITGIAGGVAVALAGLALGPLLDFPQLPALAAALAPTVWLANMGVLPTALLVRRREWRAWFLIELASAVAMAGLWVGLAVAGLGAWALVAGWWGNALVYAVAAHRLVRGHKPDAEASDDLAATVRYGRHMAGANLLTFSGDRLDVFVVATLGRLAYGLYAWAQYVSLFLANYVTSLAERMLFPVLADQQRRTDMGRSAREALRVCVTVFIPAHVLLAAVARPLVTTYLEPDWHGAGTLLALLALASAARCLDVVGITILKAAGWSGSVLSRGALRMALLVVAVLALLGGGAEGVAGGVLLARGLAAAVVLGFVMRRLEPAADDVRRDLAMGVVTTMVWCAAFLGASWWVGERAPASALWALPLLALGLWVALRLLLDRRNAARDASALSAWWGEAGA